MNIKQVNADLDLYEKDPESRPKLFADEEEHKFARRLSYIGQREDEFKYAKDYMWKYHGRHTYKEDFKLLRKLVEKLNGAELAEKLYGDGTYGGW